MAASEPYMIPRYLKIAVDLCTRIAGGELDEGEKLKGRSLLSTEYNVSPETIRRAMSILSDRGVVQSNVGSGIVISSRAKAVEFLTSFRGDEDLARLRAELAQMLERRRALDEEILAATNRLIEAVHYRRTDLISPVAIGIPRRSHVVGKSIGNLRVWENTGATVIGVVQGGKIILSPGPYYEFDQGDKILIVGDENVVERFHAFLDKGR